MVRCVGMAAWFLHGRELHDFDARPVGIVSIQAILAIAPHFGPVEFLALLIEGSPQPREHP